MATRRRILYLTAEGILQPIGQSQVARVVEALAARGFPYDVYSLERPEELAPTYTLRLQQQRFEEVGVRWRHSTWDPRGGATAAASNLGRLVAEATRAGLTRTYALLHARAYHGAFAAWTARTTTRAPFVFDTRSYWLDERVESGQLGRLPGAVSAGRWLERRFFADAAAVVSLTELQAEDVRRGRFGGDPGRPIVAIPTCADYSDFTTGARTTFQHVPEAIAQRLRGVSVVGFIGSINPSYLVEESAALARAYLDLVPSAQVLALSPQTRQYRELFERHGIPTARTTISAADHRSMPEWLSLVDWAVHLLKTSASKRGSMPTKLAEFFAAGVRPVHHGCNPEVTDWVRRAGSGLVLDDLEAATLRAAASAMAATPRDPTALETARALTHSHFSLASGVDRYAALLEALISTAPRSGVYGSGR